MSAVYQRSSGHVMYPAKYFSASTTYDTWVKLTIADVHALRTEPGFEGQNIFFHLNHPIQFIYIVAPIVGFEDQSNYNLAFLTLDDSSGSCIDVKIPLTPPSKRVPGEPNTSVQNLHVESSIGRFDIFVDGVELDVCTTVKAKCTIENYKGLRQLVLKRINIIKDTNEEAAAWKALAQFRRDVLYKPWVLRREDMEAVDKKRADEERGLQERQRRYKAEMRKREVRRAEREEKKALHEERVEMRRRAAEKKMNAGALPGTDWCY